MNSDSKEPREFTTSTDPLWFIECLSRWQYPTDDLTVGLKERRIVADGFRRVLHNEPEIRRAYDALLHRMTELKLTYPIAKQFKDTFIGDVFVIEAITQRLNAPELELWNKWSLFT